MNTSTSIVRSQVEVIISVYFLVTVHFREFEFEQADEETRIIIYIVTRTYNYTYNKHIY
jgi:hypothetical protein